MRKYEDNTKAYPNNQLLNFNLLRYPHSDESVNNIAYMICIIINIHYNIHIFVYHMGLLGPFWVPM